MRKCVSFLLTLCMVFMMTAAPSARADQEVGSDAALAERIISLLNNQPDSITIALQAGYTPGTYAPALWRHGVDSYRAELGYRELRLLDIRYFPVFSVCEDSFDVDLALMRYARREAREYRLFLSDSLTAALAADQNATLESWRAKAQAVSWQLSWNAYSQCLHVSEVTYQDWTQTQPPVTAPPASPTPVPVIVQTTPPATPVPATPVPATPAASDPADLYLDPNGPKAKTLDDFKQALEAHIARGDTTIDLYLEPALFNQLIGNDDSIWQEIRSSSGIQTYRYLHDDRKGLFHITEIEYRTALNILNHYRQGKQASLTSRELQTLNAALSIVNAAPSNPLERERYLHDQLCARVTYMTDDEAYNDNDQAIGALLNGEADCDGYSEAFYLLCNLAGIPARLQHGDTYDKSDRYDEDATHMWNLVCVSGNWLMIDVTWDDRDDEGVNTYQYYNIGRSRMSETHKWNEEALMADVRNTGGNAYRPAELAEGYAATMQEAEALVRKALIDEHKNRVAFTYAEHMDMKRDKEMLNAWIYSTGAEDYTWGFGGHSVEVSVTEWNPEFRIVHNDAEALAYVNQVRQAGKTTFSLYFAGSYGEQLFADELAGFHLLKGQFGLQNDDTTYSSTAHSVTIANAVFERFFSVCSSKAEIQNFVQQMAAQRIPAFSFCIPGSFGQSQLANELKGLNNTLSGTLLKTDRTLTYGLSDQVIHISNARYWPAKNTYSQRSLEAGIRQLLRDQPEQIAVWTDGTYQWTDAQLEELYKYVYRQAAVSFYPLPYGDRVELTGLQYANNYCFASSEADVTAFLKECRRQNRSEFHIYCTEELYRFLSANQFSRFFNLISGILQRGQEISYSDTSYSIGMNNVRYAN